jgi:hypothetical protein
MICAMGSIPGSLQARRRKLFALAEHLELTREDRIDLAKTILHRDIISWQHLQPEQTDRLLDALEGAILVQEIYRQRPVTRQATQA